MHIVVHTLMQSISYSILHAHMLAAMAAKGEVTLPIPAEDAVDVYAVAARELRRSCRVLIDSTSRLFLPLANPSLMPALSLSAP